MLTPNPNPVTLSPREAELIAQQIAERVTAALRSQPALMSAGDLANALDVSESTVWRLKSTGAIPFVAIGAKVRFALGDVIAALQKQEREQKGGQV